MELIEELKLALVNTGFVFEDTSEDHVVISGTPVNVMRVRFFSVRTITE
jgi:DNA mismatch repair protein MutL